MKKITQAAMTALLQEVKGAKIATIVMETPVKMNKTGNPFWNRVTKRANANVMLNFDYSKALDKAVSTTVKRNVHVQVNKRTWGDRVGETCFVMHKGEMYLVGKLNGKTTHVKYFIDGVKATPSQVKQFTTFIPAKEPQVVPLVNVHMNNVKELKIDKQHFIIQ